MTWKKLSSKETVLEAIELSNKNRRTASTVHNDVSSRSHAIYKIRMTIGKKEVMLQLVDLAGSEKSQLVTGNVKNKEEALRLHEETIFINTSLSSLRRVLSMLSDRKYKESIPYRDSKLTKMLQVA